MVLLDLGRSPNRTRVELKLILKPPTNFSSISPNRTRVELKQFLYGRRSHGDLLALIEPEWN